MSNFISFYISNKHISKVIKTIKISGMKAFQGLQGWQDKGVQVLHIFFHRDQIPAKSSSGRKSGLKIWFRSSFMSIR